MSTVEDIYDHIGGLGRFQFAAIFLVTGMKSVIAWSMMLMSYAGFIGDFECVISSDTRASELQQPSAHTPYTHGNASSYSGGGQGNGSSLNVCSINGTECAEYRFLGDKRTVISEWHLVCDLRWLKATITSIQMAGVVVGSLLGGLCGDYFGRKNTTYGSLLLHAIFNIIAAYSVTWEMFAVMRFLIGVVMGINMVMIVPYPTEFLPLRWRHVLAPIPFWPGGVMLFAGVAWWLEDWAHLQIGCAIFSAVMLLGYFIIPESPRWLATQGRLEDSHAALNYMARFNGCELPPWAMDVIKNIAQNKKTTEKKRYTYWDVFRRKKSALLTVIFSFQWAVLSITYYGISFGVNSFVGNLYLNIFIMNVVQVLGFLTTLLIVDKLGRRLTSTVFMAIAMLLSFACVFLHLGASEETRGSWINSLCQAATVAIVGCWAASQVWVTESYPTVIRSLGFAFVNLAARVGSALAPFLINLDEMAKFSFILMGTLALISMLTLLYVPETNKKAMEETVHEVQPPSSSCRRQNNQRNALLVASDLTSADMADATVDRRESDSPVNLTRAGAGLADTDPII